MSEDLCEAARAMDPASEVSTRAVVRIVQASDAIAKKLGMHPAPDPELNLLDQDAIEALELGEIEELRSAFRS